MKAKLWDEVALERLCFGLTRCSITAWSLETTRGFECRSDIRRDMQWFRQRLSQTRGAGRLAHTVLAGQHGM